jgi:hypothetical protein
MKICHEMPLNLLGHSKYYNDYEYCLPTFWFKHPEYKQHYLEAKKQGRFIILDNGLFEGDTFSNEELLGIIKELQPDIFIVPDGWNDPETTLTNASKWMNYKQWSKEAIVPLIPEGTELMVVVQGKDYSEITTLYEKCTKIGYTYFSINHSSSAYQYDECSHPSKVVAQMFGRIHLIGELYSQDYIKGNHYIHLLGASLPQEFLYYPKQWSFIKSVDTSNPIIFGLKKQYYNNWGMLEKATEKLEVFMELENIPEDNDVMSAIAYNTYKFRHFIDSRK